MSFSIWFHTCVHSSKIISVNLINYFFCGHPNKPYLKGVHFRGTGHYFPRLSTNWHFNSNNGVLNASVAPCKSTVVQLSFVFTTHTAHLNFIIGLVSPPCSGVVEVPEFAGSYRTKSQQWFSIGNHARMFYHACFHFWWSSMSPW